MSKKATKKVAKKAASKPKPFVSLPQLEKTLPVFDPPSWEPIIPPASSFPTIQQWTAKRKQELQSIMLGSTVQAALNLVRQKRLQEVTTPNYSRTGSDLVAFDSASHNETKGWFRCLEYLESLYTAKPLVETPPEPEAYDDEYAARTLREKESETL